MGVITVMMMKMESALQGLLDDTIYVSVVHVHAQRWVEIDFYNNCFAVEFLDVIEDP